MMTPAEVSALMGKHLKLAHRGKVRDSFQAPRKRDASGMRFVLVTDRLSSHDFVLPFEIEGKGEILNAITVYWKRRLGTSIPTDLAAWGRDLDQYLPRPLRGIPEIWKRATLVYELEMIPVECILRFYLTGSAWAQYAKTRRMRQPRVYGQRLPEGLEKNDPLPEPIFTPTTKAKKGHDQPLTAGEVEKQYPGLTEVALGVADRMLMRMARRREARYADTKLEFGRLPADGYALADEVGTPDSSRIWGMRDTLPHDKDYVRVGLEEAYGIEHLDPENPEHIRKVQDFWISPAFKDGIRSLYHSTPELIIGMDLEELQNSLHMV